MNVNRIDVVPENPIAAAIALAKAFVAEDPGTIRQQIADDERSIVELQRLGNTLLGVEEHAKAEIASRISSLEARIQQLRGSSVPAMSRYRIFDLAPLSWRNKQGLPLLAVFSTGSPTCTFGVTTTVRYSMSGAERRQYTAYAPKHLPQTLVSCYEDVLGRLKSLAARNGSSVKLTAIFGGLIPDHARNDIEEARLLFPDGMFVLAEVRTWSYEARKPTTIHPGDPLVIAFDGRGSFRLITAFDLTAIEQIIKARMDGKLAS